MYFLYDITMYDYLCKLLALFVMFETEVIPDTSGTKT